MADSRLDWCDTPHVPRRPGRDTHAPAPVAREAGPPGRPHFSQVRRPGRARAGASAARIQRCRPSAGVGRTTASASARSVRPSTPKTSSSPRSARGATCSTRIRPNSARTWPTSPNGSPWRRPSRPGVVSTSPARSTRPVWYGPAPEEPLAGVLRPDGRELPQSDRRREADARRRSRSR